MKERYEAYCDGFRVNDLHDTMIAMKLSYDEFVHLYELRTLYPKEFHKFYGITTGDTFSMYPLSITVAYRHGEFKHLSTKHTLNRWIDDT